MRNYFLREAAERNGSTSPSTWALMLFPFVCCYCERNNNNKNRRNHLWFIHSCFFFMFLPRVLVSSFCFVLQSSSSALGIQTFFIFIDTDFFSFFFPSFILPLWRLLDNCHTGRSVRVSFFPSSF